MSERVARHATVHGRVQGVFYRATVARAARTHGVSGWAANRPDGSVEVFLEGEPEAVEAVMAAVRSGPRGAEVQRVEVADAAPEGLADFDTR